MLRVLDLFSGAAGGWSLGLHRAGGFKTVAACEADAWRREQYARNFPGVALYDDVRTLRGAPGLADVVVGSPPCQDASSANAKGRGVDGERTGLFFEAVRIIGEVRPRWACLENVPGIRRRGIDRVIDALGEIDYACWPLVVGASDVGANHRRKRLVLVAYAAEAPRARAASRTFTGGSAGPSGPVLVCDGADPHGQGQHDRTGHDRGVAGGCQHGGDAPNADEAGLAIGEGIGRDDGAQCKAAQRDGAPTGNFWAAGAPDFGRVDDGLSDKVARACISAYGDAFLPQIAEIVGRAILRVDARL